MNIAQPLSDILKERGISRSRLARDIKVHTSTVTNWLKGKDIKPDNLSALCDYFGCSPTLLIDPSKTEHYYMLQKNYGDKVAAAYISGDYDEYQKLLEEAQQKKPAPIAESELSELQKQAIQFVLSLSDDQLRQFIRIGKALINEK